ncbi:hypothetical protein [Paenibacillus prosopidis]|uniref:hypothetical protein n=1 Tax=Paenibacillus prosopidis TaxID=630520 RepID=UPI0011C0668E|nr:hypothetical protein [Paenibacillus prosopidis]
MWKRYSVFATMVKWCCHKAINAMMPPPFDVGCFPKSLDHLQHLYGLFFWLPWQKCSFARARSPASQKNSSISVAYRTPVSHKPSQLAEETSAE